jgi:hypothetical protein
MVEYTTTAAANIDRIDQALRRRFGALYKGVSVEGSTMRLHFDDAISGVTNEAAIIAAANAADVAPREPVFSANTQFNNPIKREVTAKWQSRPTFRNSRPT